MIVFLVILVIAVMASVTYIIYTRSFEINTSREDEIRKEAIRVHDGQRYDDKPYAYHLEMVARNAIKYSGYYIDEKETEEELIRLLYMAAWFHDSLEDCPDYTYHKLLLFSNYIFDNNPEYAKQVAEIVYACTNEKGRNRKERQNFKYYKGIRDTKYAPYIKACDRLANIEYSKETKSKLYEMYRRELKDFLSSIHSDDNPIPPELYKDLCQYLPD